MTTIGIDIRVLASGRKTGIEEYTLNLLTSLLKQKRPGWRYKLFYNGLRKVELDYSWLQSEQVEIKSSRIPNRLLNLLTVLFKYPKIDHFLGPIDLFFSPHFLPVALPNNCPRIITFHDLSFRYYPHFFSWGRRVWHYLTFPQRQAKQADRILVDTLSTKEDLVTLFQIKPEKIRVVPLGLKKYFRPSVRKNEKKLLAIRKKYKLPKRFILYFGTIEPRKNLLAVIKAFRSLKESERQSQAEIIQQKLDGQIKTKEPLTDLKLVIAGSNGWLNKNIFKSAQKAKMASEIIFTGPIEDEDKPFLYGLCQLFVYPSFFEGFGFPPLEAMACGVPTIVSNSSSLPEVVGQGALMIDPYNIDELKFAFQNLLSDKNLRERLIKAGLEQVKKFDWDKTAKETLDNFLEICLSQKK